MRHGVSKIKFSKGRDATKNMVSKLAKNFVIHARIETTLKKVKVLKPVVEKMVDKAKKDTEANKNYLLKILRDKKLVDRIYKDVGENFKDRVGGYVRVVRLGVQRNDGAETARLEWIKPIVVEKPERKKPKKVSPEVKPSK